MALRFACEVMTSIEMVKTLQCPCKYDVVRDLVGDDGVTEILEQASDMVTVGTGGAVTGRCARTVRPCTDGVCGCTLYSGCTCCDVDAVVLPGPDIAIIAVKVDGVALPTESYALFDGNKLIRTDGTSWPGNQRLYLTDDQPRTWSITYTSGVLPWVAKMAATELACDLMTAVDPGGQAKLPKQAIQAIMDNVTVQLDPETLGLFPWCERLFRLYPAGPPPVIWSPELAGRHTLHTLA